MFLVLLGWPRAVQYAYIEALNAQIRPTVPKEPFAESSLTSV